MTRTYRYMVVEENTKTYVDVEHAGKVRVHEGENAEDRAKALVVSTQQIPEHAIDLEKVDDLNRSVVTSGQVPSKKPNK